jgi:hypothetical protein
MSKKVLNTQAMINELKGQSAFFRQDVPSQSGTNDLIAPTVKTTPKKPKKLPASNVEKETPKPVPTEAHPPTDLPIESKNDTVNSDASNHANAPASVLANIQDDIVETIRKTVKQVGKDTLFVRLTPDEKHQVTSVVYALNEMYRGEGRKTSENEIGRIGLNFLLEDYKVNGEQSILAKVLVALNA